MPYAWAGLFFFFFEIGNVDGWNKKQYFKVLLQKIINVLSASKKFNNVLNNKIII